MVGRYGDVMSTLDFWRSEQGLEHITPRGKQWPEGDGFPRFIRRIAGENVLEFGCGIGRLAECFDPAQYVGVDVSAHAVSLARKRLPQHLFFVVGDSEKLPTTTTTLAHTVLLHIPDGHLGATVARFTSPRVLVSEILGRSWRRTGEPPVFNREAEEYASAFAPRYKLASSTTRPYPHYTETYMTLLEFEAC